MALHDPDSSVREEAIALKMGRQKRIQIIDGQQVEIYTGLDDEEEEEELEEEEEEEDEEDDEIDDSEVYAGNNAEKSDMIAVSEDGQRYMVVEVINMEDEEDGTTLLQAQSGEDKDPMDVDDFILSTSTFRLTCDVSANC